MIYVNEILKRMILRLKDAKDLADEFNDLNRIELAINYAMQGLYLTDAEKLDNELYKKYPTINVMLNISNKINNIYTNTNKDCYNDTLVNIEKIISNLKQDKCGIFCHMILKKGIASCIENIIIVK